MRFEGQQRVMRWSGAPLWSPVESRALTNRMREIFTYGSVGGAEETSAPTRHPSADNVFSLPMKSFIYVSPGSALGHAGRWACNS